MKIGSTITFGPYRWKVLKMTEDEIGKYALIITENVVACKPYNEGDIFEYVTWETCSLRSWLNELFLRMFFSADDQKRICTVRVKNPRNSEYDTEGGNDTKDKVFLLTMDEAKKFLEEGLLSKCRPNSMAEEQGVRISNNGCCSWWLRSPGDKNCYATFVDYDGVILKDGYSVNHDDIGVRPAMWINIEA